MKLDHWLREAEQELVQAGLGTARLDALVLLEDVTGIDRAKLLAEPEHELGALEIAKLKKLLKKRAQHVPLAYVRGKTEFFARSFIVTPAVLEPRPESETMIELLLALPDLPKAPKIADVGAGSGALGITAKLELPDAEIELLELDPEALKIAKINVDLFTLQIPTLLSDLLAQTDTNFDVLLCNLPYVPDDHQLNAAALQEPKMAIFGGPDGLNVYRKLFKQLRKRPKRPLYILTESLPPQHGQLAALASENGYKLVKTDDFIQLFRRN